MPVIHRIYAGLTSALPATPAIGDLEACEVFDLSVTPYGGDRETKNISHAGTESQEKYTVDPYVSYSFGMYFASSGTPGTAPPWGKFLMACGYDETIDPGVDAQYSIPSDPAELYTPETVDIWRFVPAVSKLQKSPSCNGQAQLELVAGKKGAIMISNMMGNYNTPEEDDPPSTHDVTAWKEAANFVASNLPTCTVDGYSACISEATIPLGIQVNRSTTTCQGNSLEAVDAEGTLTFIEPDIATKNFYSKFESHNSVTPVDVSIQIGDTAGSIVMVGSASVQLYDCTETVIDGKPALQVSCVWLTKPTFTAK